MPRREKVGTVVSDKMEKTCVVAIEERRRHPRYHKIYKHTIRFKAHNDENKAKTGDVVRIVESRPLSAEKRWSVSEIIKHIEEV